jgi:arylsulfatase A-like enzyme
MTTGASRRTFLKRLSAAPLAVSAAGSIAAAAQDRPNILLLMSDNHCWNHLGCYGDRIVRTPNIDRLASQGVRFTHAFCPAPSCSPARAAILSGQEIWRLEEGANLWGIFPNKFPLYTDLLAAAGYHVGCQGKAWGPGNVPLSGRATNHGGQKYSSFVEFLKASDQKRPWCFWVSSQDPHRPYDVGSGRAAGLDVDRTPVPPYLPDTEAVRSDICDYYRAIERFDGDVGQLLDTLRQSAASDNTLVVLCSDNGWQMPRGLANLYDAGTRVPLLVSWPARVAGGRVVDDMVDLKDLAPTFLDAAQLPVPKTMTARSLMGILRSNRAGRVEEARGHVLIGRERHALCRQDALGYPARAIRTYDHLYIRNFAPDRWPAGDPPLFGDVDAHMLHYPCATKLFLLARRQDPKIAPLFDIAFAKRPAEELYDLGRDPHQMHNLAGDPAHDPIRRRLAEALTRQLKATGDPRVVGGRLPWDTTMYYQPKDFLARPSKEAIDMLGLREEYNYLDSEAAAIVGKGH